MPWETIFSFGNMWVVPFWLLLALGPRNEFTGKIVLYGGIGLVALIYAILLPLLMGGLIDAGGGDGEGSFSSLAGVMALFSSKGGVTIGWLHYLAFDLFVGLWVARNADERGIARWIQIPFLLFALMAGPLGLTLYLFLRGFLARNAVNAALPH